ncbi:MAG: adenylate/guanylate cyclase domain-containing protein [Acidimicrobiia bacterium]
MELVATNGGRQRTPADVREVEVAFLFTDLAGSTALYDRLGDSTAFDLVRWYFHALTELVKENSGAVVKTIGDEVMASFPDPLQAMKVARETQDAVACFNQRAQSGSVHLRFGAHAGTALEATLNGQRDYFGQVVNVAAVAQGAANADELVMTDEMFRLPGAGEVLANRRITEDLIDVKGIDGSLAVRRIARNEAGVPYEAALSPSRAYSTAPS